MSNTTEALPYPFDPARPLRDANRARIGLIYKAALDQSERTAQKGVSASDESVPSNWPLRPDMLRVTVMPVAPSATLLRPKELGQSAAALLNGETGNFFEGSSTLIPMGMMWSNFSLSNSRRSAQILLNNGTVCHIGEALTQRGQNPPIFSLPILMSRIVLCLQVAHQLYGPSKLENNMALSVSVENLGGYTVKSLVSIPMGHDTAMVNDWGWGYTIPSEIFSAEFGLDEWALPIIEEICWGFADGEASQQIILEVATKTSLSLMGQN